jgi:hypothetical protein
MSKQYGTGFSGPPLHPDLSLLPMAMMELLEGNWFKVEEGEEKKSKRVVTYFSFLLSHLFQFLAE